MFIRRSEQDFSICKVVDFSRIDIYGDLCFIAVTDEERSLVCPTKNVPDNTLKRDDGWKAFRIEGELDFSLVGILAGISGLLSENGIGLFAVSTYNTDYILTKAENYERALTVLSRNGYEII
ncbi:MAG: ACT domain-containing protein [Clostridia bacterium]|nr:ACT domain-containing protein [Clostridia bacterium]